MIRGRRVFRRVVELFLLFILQRSTCVLLLARVLRGISKVHPYIDSAYLPTDQQLLSIISSGVHRCAITTTGVLQFFREDDVLLFAGGAKSHASLTRNYASYVCLIRNGFSSLVDYPLEHFHVDGFYGYRMGLLSLECSDGEDGSELLVSFGVEWVENQYANIDFGFGLSFVRGCVSDDKIIGEISEPKWDAGCVGLMHGDLTATNIMKNASGARVLIDLDRFVLKGPVAFDKLHAQINSLEEQASCSWLEFVHEFFTIDCIADKESNNNLLWAYFLFRVGHESAYGSLLRYSYLVRAATRKIQGRRLGWIGFVTPYVGDEAGGVGKVVSCLMSSLNEQAWNGGACVKIISSYRDLWRADGVVLIHSHGLWSLLHLCAFIFAMWHKLPYLISPHGMLDPSALKQKPVRKILAWHLYQKLMLKASLSILVNSERESLQVRSIRPDKSLYILANGVELPIQELTEAKALPVGRALFLSRINPIKGVKELLVAWSRSKMVREHGYHLDIYGNVDDRAYMNELIALRADLKLQDTVHFKGAVYGDEKWKVYKEHDFFVLPSRGENFGIVVAEALFAGLPVITTKWTPWSNLQGLGFGFEAQDLGWDLVSVLDRIIDAVVNDGLLGKMHEARGYVQNSFSWQKIAIQYSDVYQELLVRSLSDTLKIPRGGGHEVSC